MEPSVEEGFSFLDLEGCDVEARQYLETIIEQRGRSVTRPITGSNESKPSDKGELAEGNPKLHSNNAAVAKLPETTGSVSYAAVSKSSEEGRIQYERAVADRTATSNPSRTTTSEKETIVANYAASINVALSSRGSIRGGPQHPASFQAPQPVKIRPIQQAVVSSGVSTYLADTPQVSSTPIAANAGATAHGGNVPQSFHAQSGHPIQHHQQAYAAAAAAAANVQQQHSANQQTPYVFINQVTANVNVHHGPAPNGAPQHPNGAKDTGSNNGVPPGANQQLQMQHSPGMAVIPNHSSVPGPPSLQNTQPTGIHPIHMQSGQMGHSNVMVPQSMNQPPPLQTNIATSLAASGITHPSGTAMLPPIMPNTFQLPHQMPTGPIPYNAIPPRSGSVQPQQQSSAHPNPATMMSMQQLQQQMYGYPIFFTPNVTQQIPPYAASGALHGMPQPQMAQVHPAHVAHMTQVHPQLNVQQNMAQRQGMPPLQSQQILLRNPLSPPAMQQGSNSSNQSAVPVSQSHQKMSGAASYTSNQRSGIPSTPTSHHGVSQNITSQTSVPRMVPSMTSPPHMQHQTPLNPQAAYFPSQQTSKANLSAPAVATAGCPPTSIYMADPPQNKSTVQEKVPIGATQRVSVSSVSSSFITHDTESSTKIAAQSTGDGPNEIENAYEEVQEKKQSSNDDLSTQEEEDGLAFGTVDLKSLVPHGDVLAFESDNVGFQYSEHIEDRSEQINPQSGGEQLAEQVKYCDEKDVMLQENITGKANAATDQDEENRTIKHEKDKITENASEGGTASDLTPKTKSWASLFKSDSSISTGGPIDVPSNNESIYLSEGKPTARIPPYKENLNESVDSTGIASQTNPNDVAFSGKDVDMGNYLKDYSLNHRAPSIKPRGLSNRSNWCFVNAILQALVACPPFYNLMKSLPKDSLVMPAEQANPSVKILRAVYYFFAEFSPLDNFPKLNRAKNKKNEDLPLGKILEPTTIYNFLLELDSDTFKVIEGRQEDAEEFLSFLLNGLNDEMIALLKLVEQQERDQHNESDDMEGTDADEKEEDDGNDEEWREVGPRGTKSCVTRRVEKRGNGNCAKSPLAEMFQGQMRSQVQHSNVEPTATLQPFLTLQLDIQSEKISNVADAIACNFAEETIDGYMCSKTNQEIEASRSMSLEELPPILVLHLKRFIYDGSSNGCQKLLKNIDFPVDLEINRDILSSNSRNKYPVKQRQYKLFAVVYHNGSEATKGHYVTDIYHTGLSTWLRCDDSILKTQSESMVLAHSATSVPYILFYRRGDTMVGGSQNEKGGNKNLASNSNKA